MVVYVYLLLIYLCICMQGRWKHFNFGQAEYSGGVIHVATSMLDRKMDWNCGLDYGI